MAITSGRHEFEDFFRRQYRNLVAYLSKRTTTSADAEEIAQESCIKLLDYGPMRARPEVVWKALLYRIAANLATDHYRRSRREPTRVSTHVHEEGLSCDSPDPYDWAWAREEMLTIRSTLLELAPRTRRMFLLSRVHGKTYQEIAEFCGVSVKTVEKHISIALRSLKRVMKTQDG